MAKNYSNVAKKWKDGFSNAGKAVIDGVNGVTESPTAAAARKLDVAKMNYIKSIDDGTTAAALNKVSVNDWKKSMIEVGVPRMASGANKGESSYKRYSDRAIPVWQQAREQAKAMPSGTEQDAINKMVENMKLMRSLKGS